MCNVIGTIVMDEPDHHLFFSLVETIASPYGLYVTQKRIRRFNENDKLQYNIEPHWYIFSSSGMVKTHNSISDFLTECKSELEKAGATNIKTYIDK